MRARKVYGGGVSRHFRRHRLYDHRIYTIIGLYIRTNFLLTQYIHTIRAYVWRMRRSSTLREQLRREVEWNGIIRRGEREEWRRRWKRNGEGEEGGWLAIEKRVRGLRESCWRRNAAEYRLSYALDVSTFSSSSLSPFEPRRRRFLPRDRFNFERFESRSFEEAALPFGL